VLQHDDGSPARRRRQVGTPDLLSAHHQSSPCSKRTAAASAALTSRRVSGCRRSPASYSRTRPTSA